MANHNYRFNVQTKHDDALKALAAKTGRSRSNIVSEALAAATDDFPKVMATLLYHGVVGGKHEAKPASYSLDRNLMDKVEQITSVVYTPKDHFLRLALDYYLNHIVKAD
jgi:hypothetical protein